MTAIDKTKSGAVAVVVHAPDKSIRMANQEALRLFGMSFEQMQGKAAHEPDWCFVQDDGTPIEAEEYPVERVIATRQPVEDVLLGLKSVSNGETVWVVISALPEFDADEEFLQVVVTYLDVTQRQRIEEANLFLLQGGNRASGGDFFMSLARYLAQSLAMDYVCIDRLCPDNLAAETLAVYSNGRFEDNAIYSLKDTPCGNVVKESICCFPKGVRHMFPKDAVLQEMEAESYFGTIISNSQGQPVGLIALIGRRPLANPQLVESILKLVVVRASSELERRHAEAALHEADVRFRAIFEHSPYGALILDPTTAMPIEYNDQVCQQLGYTREEFSNLSVREIEYTETPEEIRAHIQRVQSNGRDEFETLHRTKLGEIRNVLVTLQSLRISGRDMLHTIWRDITEHKKAEAALRGSEQRLATITAAAPVVLWAIDQNGIFTLSEGKGLEALGLRPGQVVGQSVFDVYRDYPDLLAAVRRALMKETCSETHEVGGLFFESRFTHLQSETGESQGVIGISVNITERQKAEEALRESEYFFKESQRAGYIGSYKTDFVAGFWESSEVLDRIFGIDKSYVRNLAGWLEIIHPDDREMMGHYLTEEVIGKRGTFNKEYRIVRKSDGEVRWVNGLGKPGLDADGNVVFLIGTIQDITERKRVEEQFERSERNYREIFNSTNEAIFIEDSSTGRILDVNDTMLRLYGYESKDEVLNGNISNLSVNEPPYTQREAELLIRKAINEGPQIFEWLARKRNGEIFWIEVSLRSSQIGGHGRVLAVARDIAERKRMQEALEKRIVALTRPLARNSRILFEDLFNLVDIQRIQDEFAAATGVASIITHPDGTPITKPSHFTRLCGQIIRKTKVGCANCYQSGAILGAPHLESSIVQVCLSGGLWDAGASIVVGGHHIANWLIGQVRDETQTEESMRDYARDIGADEAALIEAFREVPSMSRDKFERVAQALFTLAKQLSTSAYQNVQQARFIAERQMAEEALRKSEAQFRSISSAAQDAVVKIDDMGCISFWNEAANRMFGYANQEAIGRNLHELIAPQRYLAAHQQAWPNFRAVGQSESVGKLLEFYALRKDGVEFPVELSLASVRQGEEWHAVGIIRDITDRKRAENALQEERILTETLLRSLPGIFYLYSYPELRLVRWNKNHETLLGYEAGEIANRSVFDWHPPEMRELVRQAIEMVMERGENLVESNLLRKDGHPVPFLVTGVRVEIQGALYLMGVGIDITEPKRAEAALHENEARQLAMIANIADVIAIVDENGINRHVSPNIQRWFGWQPEEVSGELAWNYIHPDDLQRIQIIFAALLKEPNSTNTQEFRYRCKEGNYIWIECTGVNLLHNPAIRGVLVNYHDITERRQAEVALRESSQFNRQIIDSAHEGIVVYGKDLSYQVWNPFMEALSGRKACEVLGKNPLEIFPFLKEMGVMDRLKLALSGEIPDPAEFPFKLGEKCGWTLDTSSPLRNSNGEIIGVIATVQDTTERKRSEAALLQNERKYRELVDNANSIILRLNMRGEIIFLNEFGLKFFGWSAEEITGRNVVGTIVPETESTGRDLTRMLQQLFQKPTNFEQNINENKLRDGSRVWVSWANKMVVDAEGRAVEVFSVGTDITERKKAQDEKEKLQAQLIQAQKMESVGRLAGGVAHDFNNMLTAIQGNVSMVMEDIPPESPLRENLEEIQKCAQRSADLTRQLLAFARKQTVAPKVLDLNATVEGMLKMLRRLIGEDINLVWVPGTSIWSVRIDPSQIDQLLANLCVNARDAIGGVGKVTIETASVSFDEAYVADHPGFFPGEYVLLAVSDNGCGMDKEVLGHLFEPFFTTKAIGEGTGLGLATVYGIIKQNQGFINVYSEPGHGSTFKLYLPRYSEKVVQTLKEVPAQPAQYGHETVLLVEDEPTILRLGRRMIESLGYTVLTADTPGEAIRLAEEHAGEIHLLMTDVIMPEMNGRDLAKRLLSLYPNIKRLFMSGYTADVIAHHGVLDEGVHFLQKPFSKKDLALKLREALAD